MSFAGSALVKELHQGIALIARTIGEILGYEVCLVIFFFSRKFGLHSQEMVKHVHQIYIQGQTEFPQDSQTYILSNPSKFEKNSKISQGT
jgi:hypothetical protein